VEKRIKLLCDNRRKIYMKWYNRNLLLSIQLVIVFIVGLIGWAFFWGVIIGISGTIISLIIGVGYGIPVSIFLIRIYDKFRLKIPK